MTPTQRKAAHHLRSRHDSRPPPRPPRRPAATQTHHTQLAPSARGRRPQAPAAWGSLAAAQASLHPRAPAHTTALRVRAPCHCPAPLCRRVLRWPRGPRPGTTIAPPNYCVRGAWRARSTDACIANALLWCGNVWAGASSKVARACEARGAPGQVRRQQTRTSSRDEPRGGQAGRCAQQAALTRTESAGRPRVAGRAPGACELEAGAGGIGQGVPILVPAWHRIRWASMAPHGRERPLNSVARSSGGARLLRRARGAPVCCSMQARRRRAQFAMPYDGVRIFMGAWGMGHPGM